MRSAVFAAALAGVAMCSQVHAASFDCAKAQSFSEKAVCDTPQLSTLDDTLGSVYAKAYAAAPNKAAIAATRIHEWHWRQSHCRDMSCVEDWYTRRIAELEADYAQSTQRDSVSSSGQNVLGKSELSVSAADHQSPAHTRKAVPVSTVSTVSTRASAGNHPPLPPEAAAPSPATARIASGNASSTSASAVKSAATDAATATYTTAAASRDDAAISWSLPATSTEANYPPLPPMSSHTPMDTRRIRPLDTTASVSSRTIGLFVGF